MDRALIKLYLYLTASVALAIAFLPMTVQRTSTWMTGAGTRVELMAYAISTPKVQYTSNDNLGKVVIVMDDGWETQYITGYKTLKDYGFKANIAVIPSTVGTPGYMNYKQLAELYMHGWDLLNHTNNHYDLLALPEAEQEKQIIKGVEWLNSHGFNRGSNIVIFPMGSYSQEIIQLLKDRDVVAARSLNSLWSANVDGTRDDVEICNLISSISFNTVTVVIEKAINNRSAVILVLHKIEPVTNDTQMQLDEELFLDIVEYIAANEDRLDVVTMTELLTAQGSEAYEEHITASKAARKNQ